MDWTTVLISALGGGGALTGVIEIARAKISKRKSPYDMMCEMLDEQRRFYAEKNAELDREKRDSACKSAVIQQTAYCKHKYKDPTLVCPVDKANEERLRSRCDECDYQPVGGLAEHRRADNTTDNIE